jgi:hypothetical protein
MLIQAFELEEIHLDRCGFIPYVITEEGVFVLLAKHGASQELGDFGGGVRKDESSIQAGLREFYEETLGIFDLTKEDVGGNIAILNRKETMAIIFTPVSPIWLAKARTNFLEKVRDLKSSNEEITDVVWVSFEAFIRLIYGGKIRGQNVMWSKIQRFFKEEFQTSKLETALKLISAGIPTQIIRAQASFTILNKRCTKKLRTV